MFNNNLIKICLLVVCSVFVFTNFSALKVQAQDDVWVATFQLVWNDLMDNVVKGPVYFKGATPKLAKELNKQEFKSDMISADSYYKICAKKTKSLKSQIEKAIFDKFNEKSDVLDKFDWNDDPNDAYFLYAMLVKNLEFASPFKVLPANKFKKSKSYVKYFGIDDSAPYSMKKNVRVLFYDSDNDYAIALKSKTNEEVILYRTSSRSDFNSIYEKLVKKSSDKNLKLQQNDTVRVPFVSISKKISYDELCNKQIKNTDNLFIKQALQTVQFYMDNNGAKLKSEAAMNVSTMSLHVEKGREFNFDNDFVLFLKESNKSKPYFALRVNDTKYLVAE